MQKSKSWLNKWLFVNGTEDLIEYQRESFKSAQESNDDLTLLQTEQYFCCQWYTGSIIFFLLMKVQCKAFSYWLLIETLLEGPTLV